MKRDRVCWTKVTGFSLVACTALLLASQAAAIWLATRRTGTGMLYDWSITLFLLSFFVTLFLIPVALIGLPFRATRLVVLAALSALAVHMASSMLIGRRLHEWWVLGLTYLVYNPLQAYPPRARRLGEWAYVAAD